MTIIGIDGHKRTHTLVAIDDGGRKLGQKTVCATSSGHADAMRWATTRFGTDLTWGVEDNRSVTGLLERDLIAGGPWPVKRCPPQLMARSRVSARERGKSDPIDALAVARVVLREPNLPVAVHDAVSWALKLLVDRREDLVGQRVAVINRLFWRLHQFDPTCPEPKKLQFAVRREALGAYLRAQSGLQAELAAEEVADLCRFSENIGALTARIIRRVNDLGSTLSTLPGCAELTAAKLISEAANADRFPQRKCLRQIRWPSTGSAMVRLDQWTATCMPFGQ